MKKIGILGGSFNPIHMGHLLMAEHALEQMCLDQVIFMPLKNPPHKNKQDLLSDEDRINMINLAIASNPCFKLSTIETDKDTMSYTADSLKILHEKDPNNQYYFIVGTDSYYQIHSSWHSPQVIFDLSTILVINRTMGELDKIKQHGVFLQQTFNNTHISIINMPVIEISSTEIRKRIKAGGSIRYLVDDKVLTYIEQKNLYRR